MNISNKLKIEKEELLKKYARWVPRPARWTLLEKPRGDDLDCIFLENGKQCGIYDVRPVQCRTYPFWPNVVESPASWKEEQQSCEGIDIANAPVTPADTITSSVLTQHEDTRKTYQVGRYPTFNNDPTKTPL